VEAGRTAAVVLAAGFSARFGTPKSLARLDGRSLLEHVLDVVASLDFAEVVVVLGSSAAAIEEQIRWRSERRILNANPDVGLSSSLRIGLSAVGSDCDAAMILLGDQPLVRREVVEQLLGALTIPARPIVVPRYAGGGGSNPLLIHRAAWPLASQAQGDRGLGPVIRSHIDLVLEVQVDGSNPDVDTPDDLLALQSEADQRQARTRT
jgi:molybdenum cofactor cytidylyltransferase